MSRQRTNAAGGPVWGAGHDHYALYLLAITTGMRQGELLGLKWSAVELNVGRLAVRQSLQRQRGVGLVFVEPKTGRSRRMILLSQLAIVALREHRTHQLEMRLAAGPAWQEQDLVFTNAIGGPLSPSHVTKRFQATPETAGLPRIRFHDLRHTAATLLA